MGYQGFNNNTHKLRKIWDRTKENSNDLKNKETEKEIINFFEETLKTPLVIHDSGIQSASTNPISSATITKGSLLPHVLSVDTDFTVNLPEFFIPYIDTQLLLKLPPEVESGNMRLYDSTVYTGNYIRVKGDGSLIYKGEPQFGTGISIWQTQEELENGDFQESFTKKVFKATLEYTDGVDNYKLEGTLTQATFEIDQGTGCGGAADYDEYDNVTFSQGTAAEQVSFHKFHSISSSEIDFTSTLNEYRSVSDGLGGCNQTITDQGETRTTLQFEGASTNEYSLSIYGFLYKNGEQEGFIGTRTVNSSSFTITSRTFELLGYKIFYSANTEQPFEMTSSGNEYRLLNINDFDTPPYTDITLERNFDDYPTETSTSTNRVGLRGHSSGVETGNYVDKSIAIYKNNSNNNDVPEYHIKISFGSTLFAPAVTDLDPYIYTQNDTYSVDGSGYTLDESTLDQKVHKAYKSESIDIEYRLLVTVKNPFVFHETRNYYNGQ